jgi:hypothetical protein
VCPRTVDTQSKFVRVSLTKYSVHNLGVTLCVNTTQWEHCVPTHGRYPVQICENEPTKYSVHNLGVTMCFNTTQEFHCVSTYGRYPVEICWNEPNKLICKQFWGNIVCQHKSR